MTLDDIARVAIPAAFTLAAVCAFVAPLFSRAQWEPIISPPPVPPSVDE